MFGTCPLATGSRVGSATDPDGRGACTVTADVPLLPSLVAVTVAVPAATPFTSPLLLTVAILVLLLAHVTVRPVSAVPAESFGVAVSCAVAPTDTLGAAGLTVTAATGAAAGGVQAPRVTLQTVALPAAAYPPRVFRALTADCSVRKAKLPPRSRSVAPAGVT